MSSLLLSASNRKAEEGGLVHRQTHGNADPERQGLSYGRGTTFVIAHRHSTVRNEDNINIVLDKGRIIEAGSHDFLLARNGKYFELYMGNQISS